MYGYEEEKACPFPRFFPLGGFTLLTSGPPPNFERPALGCDGDDWGQVGHVG